MSTAPQQSDELTNCAHFAALRCRSCSWLRIPYAQQLARKQSAAMLALSEIEASVWESPIASAPMGFRNKAKLAALGGAGAIILGLPANLARQLGQYELSDCGLYEPGISEALAIILAWLNQLGIAPYQLEHRSGELKYVLLSAAPDAQLMLRFVLASDSWRARITKALPALLDCLPQLRVCSINLQPVHQAIVEGPQEIMLTKNDVLPVLINDVLLQLMPQSFFQTNSAIATRLYQSARDWLAPIRPAQIWDFYCGVGGFGLHLANESNVMTGVELSAAAVASAKQAAASLGLNHAQFIAADALVFARSQSVWPNLVLLNPPRRGVDAELCALIEASSANYVLYSSCNLDSLARDLSRLPGFIAVRAQLFDMFPNTEHAEVLVLLKRHS